MARMVAVVLAGSVLAGCGGEPQYISPMPVIREATDEATCAKFREIAGDAFGEAISEDEIRVGLEEVGSLAADAENPAIRDNGIAVGQEANAETMINGDPNEAQNDLASACNEAFPVGGS